jgi:hypothetical protein
LTKNIPQTKLIFMQKLSQQITQIFNSDQEDVTLKTLLKSIDERAFGVIIAIIALPSSIPILPGYSAFFSVFLLFLTVQLLLNRPYPWFPERFLHTKLGTSTEDKTVSVMLKVLRFFEKFTKPRLTFLYENRLSEIALSIVMILCSLSMVSPLPATGTIPALAIFLIAFGMIQDDGFFAILGILVAIVGLALSIAVHFLLFFGGQAALDQFLTIF